MNFVAIIFCIDVLLYVLINLNYFFGDSDSAVFQMASANFTLSLLIFVGIYDKRK